VRVYRGCACKCEDGREEVKVEDRDGGIGKVSV